MSARRKIKDDEKSRLLELKKKMGAERFKLYLEIQETKRSIGPVSTESGKILRELQENDD